MRTSCAIGVGLLGTVGGVLLAESGHAVGYYLLPATFVLAPLYPEGPHSSGRVAEVIPWFYALIVINITLYAVLVYAALRLFSQKEAGRQA